jgi:hypothetical protein
MVTSTAFGLTGFNCTLLLKPFSQQFETNKKRSPEKKKTHKSSSKEPPAGVENIESTAKY